MSFKAQDAASVSGQWEARGLCHMWKMSPGGFGGCETSSGPVETCLLSRHNDDSLILCGHGVTELVLPPGALIIPPLPQEKWFVRNACPLSVNSERFWFCRSLRELLGCPALAGCGWGCPGFLSYHRCRTGCVRRATCLCLCQTFVGLFTVPMPCF